LAEKNEEIIPYIVNIDLCRGCRQCLKIGCPAICFIENKAVVDPAKCRGCGKCVETCSQKAFVYEEDL